MKKSVALQNGEGKGGNSSTLERKFKTLHAPKNMTVWGGKEKGGDRKGGDFWRVGGPSAESHSRATPRVGVKYSKRRIVRETPINATKAKRRIMNQANSN